MIYYLCKERMYHNIKCKTSIWLEGDKKMTCGMMIINSLNRESKEWISSETKMILMTKK